jgi:sec-independent protein translocase protein TatA
MGPIGFPELVIILVVALIVFGPRKLPELGRSLGKSLSEFKRASNELRSTLEEEIRVDEHKAKTPPSSATPDGSTQPAASEPATTTPATTPATTPETVARGQQGS